MTITKRSDILLVEDNPNDIELTVSALKRNNLEPQLHIVRNGEEALNYIFCKNEYSNRDKKDQPRVILLDLKLPKVSGLEVLEKIKKDKTTRRIPVVVLSTSKEENDMRNSYELGANSYIVKPVDFNEFVDAVALIGQYWLLINELAN